MRSKLGRYSVVAALCYSKICCSTILSSALIAAFVSLTPNMILAQSDEMDDETSDEIDTKPQIINPENSPNTPSAPTEVSTSGSGSSTEIHVKDADITAIIKIFSKKTKRNYILDERVKGKVSIFLPSKVSDNEATRILDAILALKGFTTVPVGGNIFKVVPSKEAKKTTIPTMTDSSDPNPTATVVTRLVRLNYVSAHDLQSLLSQLVSADGLISAYSRSNSLVLIDYADNIKRIVDIVEAIDIPSSDTDMTIVPVTNADATEIADTIKDILGEEKGGDSDASSSSRAVDIIRNRLREAAAVRADGQTGVGDGNNVGLAAQDTPAKIIPDQRTNSIILVANEAETTRLRALIARLDSPVNLSSNRFYVYRCQHAKADDLSNVLSGLTGGGSSSSSTSGTNSSSSDSEFSGLGGLSGGSRSSSRSQNRLNQQQRTPGQPRQKTGTASGGTVNFGEDIAITADPATNSLIIAASKTDYEKILSLLKDLDIKRRQVLVEAMLLEVSVNNSRNLGAEFSVSTGGADGGVLASNNLQNLTSLFSSPASLANFSLAAASAGTIKLPGGITLPSQAVLLSAAESNENVNVLSAPNILTTDNEEAEIVVGSNVPFISSTSSSQENLNNTFNQVDRQDVGITLRITPQISSGDFVTLNIFNEVSNVNEASANSPLGPTTTLRTSQTTVVTKSGQMIAIGGLMSDTVGDTKSGVPLLKDIPILGQLFTFNANSKRQTNLLIFITPRIIKDQFDARDESIDYRDRLENEIRANKAEPDRSEVLQSPNLDNVADSKRVEGPKPTTIRPAFQKNNLTNESDPLLDSKSEDRITRDTLSGDKILLRARPPLPELPKIESAEDNSPKESSPQNLAHQNSQFIILKCISDLSSELTGQLPFSYRQGGNIGIVVPSISSNRVTNFFAQGSQYGYVLDNKIIEFEVVGVFNSAEEAHKKTSNNQQAWRSLSPYEIMHLGTGPWIRR